MFHRTIQEFKFFFKSKSLLSNLILINVSIWILLIILRIILFFLPPGKDLYHLFLNTFGLSPKFEDITHHPWSIFTFLFIHTSLLHLLFNMAILYFSGILFYQYLGKKSFNKTYYIGGLFGAICFVACSYFAPVLNGKYQGMVIGASPAILAILFRIVKELPNLDIFIFKNRKIKFKYLALIFLLFDLLTINGDNSGGLIAHLGGAFYGYFSIYLTKSFKQIPIKFKSLSYQIKKRQNESQKEKEEIKREKILKKIAIGGYDKLSKSEKEFIFKSK